MLEAIFFDLDGTLLPMDNDEFIRVYFRLLCRTAMQWGYEDPKKLEAAIWLATKSMIKNDGTQLNCDAFWNAFDKVLEKDCRKDEARFDGFYTKEFCEAKSVTYEAPLAVEAVKTAAEKAKRVVLASNPVFPPVATATRLSWVGLGFDDFDLVTHYQNSAHCKPNPDYYRAILKKFDLDPSKCLMVGNDVEEDLMAAESVGMQTYWLKDWPINRHDLAYTGPQGTYAEMVQFLKDL